MQKYGRASVRIPTGLPVHLMSIAGRHRAVIEGFSWQKVVSHHRIVRPELSPADRAAAGAFESDLAKGQATLLGMKDDEEIPGFGEDEIGLAETDGVDLTDTHNPADSDQLPATLDEPFNGETDAAETDLETEADTVAPVVAATQKRDAGSGFRWSLVFGAVLVVAIIILVFQNPDTVTFEFLSWSISAPLSVILLGTVLVAVILDEIVGYVIRVRRRRVRRQLAELKELKAQLVPPKEKRFGRKRK